MKLVNFTNVLTMGRRYGLALLMCAGLTATVLLPPLFTERVVAEKLPLCDQGSAVAEWVTVRHAVTASATSEVQFKVHVTDLVLMNTRAEDQVFSLKPETEGNAPLPVDILLRRGGKSYA